ncbi:MAG: energy transducer TonB [Pseudomonadota bacterium]
MAVRMLALAAVMAMALAGNAARAQDAPKARAVEPLSPGSWMTSDDYPRAALRAHEEGITHFQLAVDTRGKVKRCAITSSSGSPLLDSTACTLLTARARFNPARNARGRAVAATYRSRFIWAIPTEEAQFESWATIFQFQLSGTGETSRCTLEVSRQPTRLDLCGDIASMPAEARAALRGQGGQPVIVEVRRWQQVDGSPPPLIGDPEGVRTVFRRRAHFAVDATGKVGGCRVLERVGEDLLKLSPFDCHPGVRFAEAAQGDPAPRGATTMLSVTTRPPGPPTADGLPLRYTGTPLSPRSPGSWVVSDDYPASALRAEQSGTVNFRLEVDGAGRVTACEVTGSSGSQILDTTTCSLMRRRARFVPARGPTGEPVASSYASRMRWEIPTDPVAPAVAWASELRLTIGADGEPGACSYQVYGQDQGYEPSPCVEISELPRAATRALRGRSKGPVAIVVRFEHSVEGMATPIIPSLPAGFRRIASGHGRFDDDGGVRCAGDIDGPGPQVSVETCANLLRYSRRDPAHAVTATVSYFTDGDADVAAALPGLDGRGY